VDGWEQYFERYHKDRRVQPMNESNHGVVAVNRDTASTKAYSEPDLIFGEGDGQVVAR
jgi:hypothetical protein